MLVLGIETSCDETAAAVVDDTRAIRGELVASQLDEHRKFGGVVPEVAARAHLELLDAIVTETMQRAGVGFADLDVVAATGGPGLIGGVLVGVTTAKAIALAANKKFVAVNHLEAHALTARLTDDVQFPYLLLLVSGGHCQLLVVEGVGRYRRWGTTIDDAAGEAFDKSAKLLGLGYPGGPALEEAARGGDPARFPLPRSMVGKPGCDFSFSGLKTAVRMAIERAGAHELPHLAASTQAAIAEQLADRTARAAKRFNDEYPDGKSLVVAGGVAANATVRARLAAVAARHGLDFVAPPPRLCTDNATMVAWAGLERARLGLFDGLDFAPRPRWPLDADAPKVGFAGVKA